MSLRRSAAPLALALAALVLSGCAAGQKRGPPPAVIKRALAGAPGEAQPSRIVATEVAYARAAREEGQAAAMSRYAAPGALLHRRGGTVPFNAIAGEQTGPGMPVQWAPRTVVISCDGEVAVSAGRFRDPEGMVGNYVTAWKRQDDGEYRWTYDVAGLDDPQPPPRPEAQEGDIVVTAMDSILGLVASCPPRGLDVPPPPALPVGDNEGGARLSDDGTLRWRWEHGPDGTKQVAVDYFYEGEWVTPLEESLASHGE